MWKELFARQDVPVPRQDTRAGARLFGKLPGRDDFVRVGAQDATGRELIEWLQEGMHILGRRMNGAGSAGHMEFPTTRFLWAGDAGVATCAGLIAPSRDRAGRAFPAVIYRVGETVAGGEMTAVEAARYQGFMEAGERWWKQLSGETGREQLEAGLAGLVPGQAGQNRAALLETVAHTLRASRTDDLAQHWFTTDPERQMRDFIAGFMRLKETLLTRGAARINWGVRLPIGPRAMGQRCVLFWLSLFDALFRDRPWRAHAFWHWGINGGPGEITVFFRPPPPSYFMTLSGIAPRDGTTMDVTTHFNADLSLARAGERMQLPSCTLLELMYHWSRAH